MLAIKDWKFLVEKGRLVFGFEAASIDRNFLLNFFYQQAQGKHMDCYYWNLGYSQLQKLEEKNESICLSKTLLNIENKNVLQYLLETELNEPALYIIDDLCNFDEIDKETVRYRESQIQNLLDKFSNANVPSYLILLGEYVKFTNKLSAKAPVIRYSLPNEGEVQQIVSEFCKSEGLTLEDNTSLYKLVVACQGLPRGEINLSLSTYSALTDDPKQLAESILQHKIEQLRGNGLEFIASPDVDSAGGNDLLQQFLYDRVVKLNEPGARKYRLRPPRGMLLMGPPGTGKSLCAKLAAKALGYSLLALSWGNVLGSDNPDRTLAQILEVADCLDRVILLADDFDKGFTGWSEGGASRRLSQRLLTWMQEHTSNVMMVATINRIQLLPSEIKRRFDDGGIWFVDLPNMGAMYEIFLIHLSKYFPTQFASMQSPSPVGAGVGCRVWGVGKPSSLGEQPASTTIGSEEPYIAFSPTPYTPHPTPCAQRTSPWSDRDWYRLLKQYRGATPVEIALSVARCAQDFYCNLTPAQREAGEIEATVTIEDLLKQLDNFEMASKRDSEDLQAIRNTAYYARPASSFDRSRFAIGDRELFEYEAHEFEDVGIS
jgi:AAA+ superfamily predicted ATPase